MSAPTPAPFAVVTGASSGIGRELARLFVENGYDVLLTANDDLAAITAELSGGGDRIVRSVQTDLASFDGVETLITAIRTAGRTVDAVALNAGFGNGGEFLQIALDDEIRLIGVNITANVHLAKRLLPEMVERGSGKVLFTSSVASAMPGPYYATYAASKAFVQSFAEAIRYELKDTGVTITALLPGPTDTGFFAAADMLDTPAGQGKKDDPAKVAADGFEAMMAGKDSVVSGVKNKVQVAGAGILPDTAKAGIHAALTKPAE